MAGNLVMHAIFSEYQMQLDADQDVREMIRLFCKGIDRRSREITTVLQIIHHSEESIVPACLKVRQLLKYAQEGYQKLKETVPSAGYFKYVDHWRNITQRYCFLISLTIWLEAGILAQHETVAEVLGISAIEEENGFHLDLEDYLLGILMLCTELARFAVNSASRGEYGRTYQISKFVMEVNAAFRLLNLKNDILRKRYDALKYEVRKIEEVVYDLSLRGLRGQQEAGSSGDAAQQPDEPKDTAMEG